jgi:hypothetical protein
MRRFVNMAKSGRMVAQRRKGSAAPRRPLRASPPRPRGKRRTRS